MRFIFFTLLCVGFSFKLCAEERESLEIKANACEKMIAEESLSSTRIRAVDKAVFIGLKNLPELSEDKKNLNEHDLNVMIYRLVDEHVEDLSSKVTKSEQDKVCVEINGFINPEKIAQVREDFSDRKQNQNDESDQHVADIVQSLESDLNLKPKKLENLALVYVKPLEYYNGAKSEKYASFLKENIQDNPYYYLTEDHELADYIITPKVLKAKVDSLDATHKRLQMVLVLETTGLTEEAVSAVQNRFLLFSSEEDEQKIADRLIKKLIEASAFETVRQIERREQEKLEQNTLGRTL